MSEQARTPTHLWIVATISLLWNAYGGYDYYMTVTSNEAYLANMPSGFVDMMRANPPWTFALWAIGVWVSLAGSILLLMRSRFAATAFLISLIAAVLNFAHQFWQGPPEGYPAGIFYSMPIIISAVIALQYYYSRRQTAAGVLR